MINKNQYTQKLLVGVKTTPPPTPPAIYLRTFTYLCTPFLFSLYSKQLDYIIYIIYIFFKIFYKYYKYYNKKIENGRERKVYGRVGGKKPNFYIESQNHLKKFGFLLPSLPILYKAKYTEISPNMGLEFNKPKYGTGV